MRGNRSIFNNFLINQQEADHTRKGRSNQLIVARNEVLLYRYYFYIKLKRMQYNEALERLSIEFFLTKRTVIDLLQRKIPEIKGIITAAPQVRQLEEKYCFLNWR